MNKRKLVVQIFLLLTFLPACIEPYEPPSLEMGDSHLVVNGNLYLNSNVNYIKLHYSQELKDISEPVPTTGATVYVQDQLGNKLLYADEGLGQYVLSGYALVEENVYVLHIETKEGKEYYSDTIKFLPTPEIDTVSWEFVPDVGVEISVSSHGDENASRYYRWEFQEHWMFQTPYLAEIELVVDTVVETDDIPNVCWGNDVSTETIIGSSEKLVSNTILEHPVRIIPITSTKLQIKYSILVNQYSISAEAYKYWRDLKDNSENLGTVFDRQPFQVLGNLHCKQDPDEVVLGYFDAYKGTDFRIYINKTESPGGMRPVDGFDECEPPYMFPGTDIDSILHFTQVQKKYPFNYIWELGVPGPVGYYMAYKFCFDCSITGSAKKPDFWED